MKYWTSYARQKPGLYGCTRAICTSFSGMKHTSFGSNFCTSFGSEEYTFDGAKEVYTFEGPSVPCLHRQERSKRRSTLGSKDRSSFGEVDTSLCSTEPTSLGSGDDIWRMWFVPASS